MDHSKIALLFIIPLMLMGCNLNDNDGDETSDLEGAVNILIAEGHMEQGEPSIVVYHETEETQPCANTEIINDFEVSGEMITSSLEGILEPETCTTPGQPAVSQNFINLDNGDYLLEISHRDNTDMYNVTVSPDSITLEEQQSSFTNTLFEVSWRYPPNSFAILCGTLDGNATPCNDFVDALNNNMDLEEVTFPDHGFTPYPASTTGFEYDAPGQYFIYNDAGDFDEIGTLLQEYDVQEQAAASGFAIFLVNWEARQFVIGQ
ncbi:MAG: hypothetical protein WD266_05530 [Balneolales bacterium]